MYFNTYYSTEPSNLSYNFYKDSNISEAIACVDLMKKLEQRIFVELEQWPEHAVLNDVRKIPFYLHLNIIFFFSLADKYHQTNS